MNMLKSFNKDIVREIKTHIGRFLGLVAITAIGVAFFAGVRVTGHDMRLTADNYFDKAKLMDFRVLSSYGINDDDITAVSKNVYTKAVMPSYSYNVFVKKEQQEFNVKVHSFPFQGLEEQPDNEAIINIPALIEGRFPSNENECVVEKDFLRGTENKIGDTITLLDNTEEDITETLNDKYKIVGIVTSPLYISHERGTSSIGTGKTDYYIIVPDESFKLDVYTDLYVTVNNAEAANCYNDEYDNIIDTAKPSYESIGTERAQIRYNGIIDEAAIKLNDAKEELAEGEKEFADEIADGEQKIKEAEQKIADGEKEIAENEELLNTEIVNGRTELQDAAEKIEKGKIELAEKEAELTSGEQELAKGKKTLAETKAQLDNATQQISELYQQLEQYKQQLLLLPEDTENYLVLSQTVLQIEAAYNTESIKLNAGIEQYIQAEKILAESEAKITEGKKQIAQGKSEIINNESLIEENTKLLDDKEAEGRQKLAEAKVDLETGKKELADAKAELEEGKLTGHKKIDDAKTELADAEQKIKDIKEPEWYILDRNTNPGFVGFSYDSDRIERVGEIFPLIFFIVAALVCLTSMTRMVEEQRGQIGTLKALGYSSLKIASKYLIYSTLASLTGSVIGFLAGMKLFPTVIFTAYRILYELPPVTTSYSPLYSISATAAAVASTLIATFYASEKELRSAPALLMRPKAPKLGKNTFFDKIPFVWKRLSFLQKVTARNLIRYKKRFFMTVLGIGGSTALLLVGFGLKDSIMGITSSQYGNVFLYSSQIRLTDDAKNINDIHSKINSNPLTSASLAGRERTVSARFKTLEKDVQLFAPELTDNFSEYISLQERVSGKKLIIPDKGCVISEKLSKLLGVKAGDSITLSEDGEVIGALEVTGICENYFDHFVYLSQESYISLYDVYEPNLFLVNLVSETDDEQRQFSLYSMSIDGVRSISHTKNAGMDFSKNLGSLNYVILVLIISAGALAFVVLINLTNINITERIRELATIKVLGFYTIELAGYIYRENIVLTAIGTVVGLLLGIVFHKGIMDTVEIDMIMFGREIYPLSFIYSILLTALFAAVVNLLTSVKIKNIDMVSALKSVE